MNPEFLDILPYISAALGLAASLGLFIGVKREVHQVARRERVLAEGRVNDAIEQAVAKVRNVEAAEPVFVPVALRPGININRRVHAGRMLRRGDDVATVAAALGVPRREIELLSRVQNMVTEGLAPQD